MTDLRERRRDSRRFARLLARRSSRGRARFFVGASVLLEADRERAQSIRQASRLFPQRKIVFTYCVTGSCRRSRCRGPSDAGSVRIDSLNKQSAVRRESQARRSELMAAGLPGASFPDECSLTSLYSVSICRPGRGLSAARRNYARLG